MEPDKVAKPSGAEEVAGEAGEGATDWERKAAELEKQLADAQSSLQRQAREAERNVRRLQSSLTSQVNAAQQRAKQVERGWEDRFHSEKMATMEEAEAARYEASLLRSKVDEYEQEINNMRMAADNARSTAAYIQHFTAMGIPANQLNTRGSLQELADSGYAALEAQRQEERGRMDEYAKQIEEYKSRVQQYEEQNPDPNALAQRRGDQMPPRIATHTPGANVSRPRTMLEAIESAAQYFGGEKPTEEMLFRAVETKQLPPTVLPGLEGFPEE